jgi:hypothetical protein
MIFLNKNSYGYAWEYDRNKIGRKIKHRVNGQTYFIKRKIRINYRYWKMVLIHELVHYRFDKLRHGDNFEKRIREILHGKVFPDMNPKPVPIAVASIEEDDEHNKVYSYLVNRTQMSQT